MGPSPMGPMGGISGAMPGPETPPPPPNPPPPAPPPPPPPNLSLSPRSRSRSRSPRPRPPLPPRPPKRPPPRPPSSRLDPGGGGRPDAPETPPLLGGPGGARPSDPGLPAKANVTTQGRPLMGRLRYGAREQRSAVKAMHGWGEALPVVVTKSGQRHNGSTGRQQLCQVKARAWRPSPALHPTDKSSGTLAGPAATYATHI